MSKEVVATAASAERKELTLDTILALSVEELQNELTLLGVEIKGLAKPALQSLLIKKLEIFHKSSTVPSHQSSPTRSLAEGDGDRPQIPLELKIRMRELDEYERERSRMQLEADIEERRMTMELQRAREEADRQQAREEAERQHALKTVERQRAHEEVERQRAHELAMKQLEIAAQSQNVVPPVVTPPPFRVDTAVRLVPKFNENDVESFLISFEKIAEINAWPADKYAAVLQAHLTGKGLKVFTELSVDQCKDYKTLKTAILNAYAVVPETYRKRFRTMTKSSNETYCDFAFRLATQCKRWLEGMEAYTDINVLREVIKIEQFQESFDNELRFWMLDQKPKSLDEAARLADQYIAVRRGISTTSSKVVIPESANGVNTKTENNTLVVTNSAMAPKANAFPKPYKNVQCHYCKKFGHLMSQCYRKRDKEKEKKTVSQRPVNLVSSVPQCDMVLMSESTKLAKLPGVDPRYTPYCHKAVLKSSDMSCHPVILLRDTGCLQSLVSRQSVSPSDFTDTGEFRLIKGISDIIISVPLVEITLESELCTGTVLCGLADTLPQGIDVLVGNDLCPADETIDSCDAFVVTRAQAAAQSHVDTHQTKQPVVSPVTDDDIDIV